MNLQIRMAKKRGSYAYYAVLRPPLRFSMSFCQSGVLQYVTLPPRTKVWWMVFSDKKPRHRQYFRLRWQPFGFNTWEGIYRIADLVERTLDSSPWPHAVDDVLAGQFGGNPTLYAWAEYAE